MRANFSLILGLLLCLQTSSCAKCDEETRSCPDGFVYSDYYFDSPEDTLRFQSSLGILELPFFEAIKDPPEMNSWCSPGESAKPCVSEGYHYYKDSIAGMEFGISYFGRFTNYTSAQFYVGVRIITELTRAETSFKFDPIVFTSAPKGVNLYYYEEQELNGQVYQEVVRSVFSGQASEVISECSLSRSHGLISFRMYVEGDWRDFTRIE